jgi:hypothetical protein
MAPNDQLNKNFIPQHNTQQNQKTSNQLQETQPEQMLQQPLMCKLPSLNSCEFHTDRISALFLEL